MLACMLKRRELGGQHYPCRCSGHAAKPWPPPASALLRRWFHCACGRAGQDDLDAMGSVESWSCQGCKSFRRQMERAAARSQR